MKVHVVSTIQDSKVFFSTKIIYICTVKVRYKNRALLADSINYLLNPGVGVKKSYIRVQLQVHT